MYWGHVTIAQRTYMNIVDTKIFDVPIKTRIPFKYGIATLTKVPYTFVKVTLEADGKQAQGIAADVLPPKWFTKYPDASLDSEIEEMRQVIEQACQIAIATAPEDSLFALWYTIYQQQLSWGTENKLPPLLAGFGATLIERAMIDAYCKLNNITFNQGITENHFGIDLGVFHDSLTDKQPSDFLPAQPQTEMTIRHTIGMADPLEASEIDAESKLEDGLPQSLEENIRQYGLTHFKIKLPADLGTATMRLHAIANVIQRECDHYAFTIDGNEFFTDVANFKHYWTALTESPQVTDFIKQGLIVVEQPLHRDIALNDTVEKALNSWATRPDIIIDESDGELRSFARALQCGYRGTSHKNCKGVFKGIANACKVAQHNASGESLFITGEDLMNVGPVALLQDLAVGATLGLTHMERNGHHYVCGLTPFSKSIQEEILLRHHDLYRSVTTDSDTYPALDIQQGKIKIESVVQSPFGHNLSMQCLTP